jgi:hypothetical protein
MKPRVHAVAGLVAMLCIASFWNVTVVAEIFGSASDVACAKRFVVGGLWVLVPALAVTGASGFSLASGRTAALISRKLLRMRWVAANGLPILVPAALYLERKARLGELDATFLAVQALELIAGAINLTLMSLNTRDGLRLAGRFAEKSA